MQRLYNLRKAKQARPATARTKRTLGAAHQMQRTVTRSRGCRTCRSRKVKCDEGKSTCSRCRRSDLHCEGYEEPIFLDQGPRLQRRVSGTTDSSTEKPASETPHSTPLPSIEAYYVQFLVQKLHIGAVDDRSGFSWLARGINSTNSDSMEYISSHCLAQAFFGRYHQLPAVVEDARHAYTRTLRMVREKMEARESLHQTPLMLTIMTLAIFETVTRTSSSAWSMHTQGLAQIIQIRGPRAFHQSPTLAMFEVGRGFIIIEGIVNKHKIFLEDDQWLPRQSTVRTRPMKSQLFDILCALPSLVADLDVYETAGRPVDDGLRSRTVRILNGLFEWRWKWERMYGGCAFEVMTDSNLGLNLDGNGQPFYPTVLYFSDQLLASDIVHYDAAVAFVLRIAQETLGESWSSFVDAGGPSDVAQPTSPLCLPPHLRSASDAMTELFRLVEFHLSGGEDV